MEQKLTVSDLALGLSRRASLPMRYSEDFVRSFFSMIEEGLVHDNLVKIKGFGTFKLVGVDARESINVNTGERFEIAGHTKVSFTPDANLRDAVNKPFLEFETVILNDGTDTAQMEAIDEVPETETVDEPTMEVSESVRKEKTTAPVKEEEAAPTVEEKSEPVVEEKVVPVVEEKAELVIEEEAGPVVEKQKKEAVIEEKIAVTTETKKETVKDNKAETVVEEPKEVATPAIPIESTKNSGLSWLYKVLLGLFLIFLGYAVAEYWHPFTLPRFESSTQEDVEFREKAIADSIAKAKAEAEAAKLPKQPAESLNYPQVEGGEYWIVGELGSEVMTPDKTLLNISLKYYKSQDFVDYICTMNDIKNPNIVPNNKELRIPKLQKK